MKNSLYSLCVVFALGCGSDSEPRGTDPDGGGGTGATGSGGSGGSAAGSGGTAGGGVGGSAGGGGQGGEGGLSPSTDVTEITHRGITWHFSSAVKAGQFITGDWWVVGPVTVAKVDPEPTPGRHGSSLDPVGNKQGYDDRGGRYDATEAEQFPLTIDGIASLVSSESKVSGDFKNNGNMVTQAVLTILDEIPPADAFRPQYAKGPKTVFRWSDLDLKKLPSLDIPTSPSNAATVLELLSNGPRIDQIGSWQMQHSCAEGNWGTYDGKFKGCYGRDYSNLISEAAAITLVDVPEREGLVQALVQIGIDNYGSLRAGTRWTADGGHNSGRKFPIVFAGALLGDPDLSKVGTDYAQDAAFGENGQTYFGANSKALFGKDADPKYFLAGCSGSGAKDARDPAGLVDSCPDYRNCCTSNTWVGQALVIHQLGLVDAWNHPAYFEYVDRWMTADVSGGGKAKTVFVDAMWAAYR